MKAVKFSGYKYFVATILILSIFSRSYAQLSVSPNQTAAVLSSTIGGPGITITAPVLTCIGQANGTFTVSPGTLLGGGTVFGINSGIMLTTGKAISAAGAEPTLASTNNGTPGDPALAALALTPTLFDGCSLEFDFTAVGTSVSFNYIFGSEEYNHSTCGPYNDAFGFFISGPGIAGTQDMALVPGTNIPVTVNSVNSGVPGAGYTLANCTAMGPGSPFPLYFADNTGGTRFTYKGFTTELAATHTVTPCATYHLKMSITDAGNAIYDSGVFIEAGSLSTPTIPPSTACVGGTTTFTAPIAGGTWTSSNTAVATIVSATGVATGVSAGTATITYGISATCFLTTTITVNALSPISGPSTVCTGNSITLTDAAAGGAWSSDNTIVATIGAATGIVNGLSVGTAHITYLTAAGCSAVFTINVITAAPITGPSAVCVGYSVSLTDATTGGTWSSSNPGVAATAGGGVVNGISTGVATITYTSPAGCIATAPISVNTFYTTTVNAAICQGSTYMFGGSSYTIGGTYAHTFTTATCDSQVTLHLVVNPLSTTTLYDSICNGASYSFNGSIYTATGVYTYHTTNVNGCDSAVTLNLYVKPVPPAPSVVSPVIYCQGQAASMLSATGLNLTWYTSASGGVGSSIPPIPVTTVAGTISYYVSQTVSGCESPRAEIQVIVSPAPTAVITASRTTVCLGDTVTFSVPAVPSGYYSWSVPGGNLVGSGSTPTVTYQFNTYGNQYVYLTVTENGQCSASDSIMISVQQAPVVAFYVKPDVCLGDTVVVAVSSTTSGVTNCLWNFGDATIITATSMVSGGPFGVTWGTPGIHFITLSATTGGCYSIPVTDTVDVHLPPNATFDVIPKSTGTLCLNDSILFKARLNDPNSYYLWQPLHCFNNNDKWEIWGTVEQGRTDISLTITDPFGCKSTTDQEVNADACCNMIFPTAFTPNGDGLNDVYRPISDGRHNFHQFRIMNRWGQTVFESANSYPSWDGNFGGVPQDMGVYYFYIEYDCGGNTIVEKGDVTLIR